MTTINFEDAEYIAPTGGGGSVKEPNPYTDVIKAIALKANEAGKPAAKSWVMDHPKDGKDKAVAKVRRQMSDAGDANDPQVTIRVVPSLVKVKRGAVEVVSDTQTRITFWTTKKVFKPRKPVAPVAGSASTDQSLAVSTPAE